MPYKNIEKKREWFRRWYRTNPNAKELHRRAQKRFYERHKEQLKIYRIKFQKKVMDEVIDKLGGCCQNCGVTDRNVLVLHHIIPLKRGNRSTYGEWLKARKNPNGFKLLCANCHLKETRNQWKNGYFSGGL
jgi:5-methylcytosine-specific restriction endonuclease McrA